MRIPFVDFKLYSEVLKTRDSLPIEPEDVVLGSFVVQTKSRASVIVDNFVGRTISVYNGKESKRVRIKETMLGFRLGQLVFTKKLGRSIHNSERNRKAKEKLRRKITQKKIRRPKVTTKAKSKSSKARKN